MNYDYLIIGGGIMGLSIAHTLRQKYPKSRIALIEKEKTLGEHASGRNSGVLHAGFYYSADSLKAKLTRQGNQLMTAYCEERGITLNRVGKLVVAKNSQELAGLDELYKRGQTNGVTLQMISAAEAQEIEPRVKTYERALFSPTTASVNPRHVIAALEKESGESGTVIFTNCTYLKRTPEGILTSRGALKANFVINAAGLYADKVAQDYGFCQDYAILPFKGLYLYSKEPPHSLRTNIYPVPDLKYPFLGVHFTLTADGYTKIGPTAIPAFWREQYSLFKRFSLQECAAILKRQARLLFTEPTFKQLAYQEMRKYSRARMVNLAQELLTNVEHHHYSTWGKPGIRAQLFSLRKNKLEMDFVVEGDAKSLHVLNAVSPAFTCAFSFAHHLCKNI